MSPSQALATLLTGNTRYMQDRLLHPDRTLTRRAAVLAKQEPFAVILGCSDSRVTPEIIFDQGIGDLFVIRVAGNVIGPLEMESLSFAVKQLHASLVVVLGHESCGAVTAVLHEQITDIPSIAKCIAPAVQMCKAHAENDLLAASIQRNAQNIAMSVKETPSLQGLIRSGKLDIVAGYYHLGSGHVQIL